MSNAGKTVKVHYIGTFDDGKEFDSSVKRGEPLEFECGAGRMIKGFDAAVENMTVGETKKIHLMPEEAYGPYREEAVQSVPLSKVPNGDKLPVGERIMVQFEQGIGTVLVKAIEGDNVIFDMNHELAGKELNFEITLIEVAE